MHLRTFVWGSAALLLSSTGLSVADTPDCLKGFQVVELQPYEVICDGTTSASTRTRTYIVPFEPLGTGTPDQPGTPGSPDTPDNPQSPGQPGTPGDSSTPGQPGEPGRPQVPGQPIVPGQPESPDQPESPPGIPPVTVVTLTITGTPPPVKTDATPPPRGGTRTITVYTFPPSIPGTTTSFVTGGTPGTTTFPPADGCSGSQCIETVVYWNLRTCGYHTTPQRLHSPISSEAPSTTTDVPSSTEESSSTIETSSAQESTTSEEPTTTEDPTSSEEPTTTEPATTTIESTTAQESTTSEEPTTSAQPTTSTEPTTTEAPTSTEESTTSDAPSTTTSETPPCTPGLEWAFYNFEQGTDGTTEPGRIPYHPTERTTTWSEQTFQIGTSLSGQSPGLTGTTTTVGIPVQNQDFTVYGTNTGTDSMYNIVQHIGYFHPNKAGTYTFNLPGDELDDVVYTWFGDSARSGYNNGNAYYIADYYAPTARSFTYEVQNAGDYIPFRLAWVNAQDGGGFGFSVTDPDGNVILSDSTPTTDGQFVNGCADSVDAPPFDF
ncbi:hypothetical protein CDV36_001930 [Fusarium kuroshium]|uniref:PA14 domain-containing protein n=1 Tax=Fusarium kuroshium TaxID=2010991 RepID=A0A3M2SLL0_9HYPO|nr:hypothetical protein CDV36_001930 [Fusarium kuroshium]